MKKHLYSKHGTLFTIMRVTFYQLVCVSFLSAMAYAHTTPAQELLNRGVTLKLTNVALKEALSQLEKSTQVRFAYSSDLIRLSQPVSVEANQERLASVLDRLLTPLQIEYRVVNNQILLAKARKRTSAQVPEREEQPGFFVQPLDVTIGGKVISADNEPLPGVSVVIKGTTRGTTTDAEGTYQLSVPDQNTTLVFSFVGYISQEVAVGNRTQLNVTLAADVKALNEVVVVGYGTQKRADITGSVSSVSAKDIQSIPTPSLDGALAGKMPGVHVSQTTGTPGGGLTVRVRGTGSIGAGNEPLYVIDGFPVTANYNQNNNPLNSINPNDIESIEVLKDASATAIYGSRGSNGVVIITTKSGKSGKMKVDIDTYAGVQNVTKYMDLMNAREFAQYIIDSRNNAWVDIGGNPSAPNSQRSAIYQILPALQNPEALGEGTNWQKEIFRTAPMQNLQATVSGGTDNVKYLVSGNYFRQDGVVINSDFERYALRINLEANASRRFKVGVNLTPAYTVSNPTLSEGHWSSGAVVLSALTLAPHLPVYDENGKYTTGRALGNGFSSISNPVKQARERTDRITDLRLLGTVYGEYKILDNLTYKLLVGTDLLASNRKTYRPSTLGTDGNPPPTIPVGGYTTDDSYNWLVEHTLNYSFSRDNHQLDALGGFTAQRAYSHSSSISSTNFPNDLVETLNAGLVTSASTSASEWSLLSYLARVNYSYMSKYLLTGTIRRDGSSRFGTNNKWGVFPSVSAGWRISEEAFLKSFTPISELKLRASYGFTGNNFIGNYDHVGLLTTRNYVFGGSGGAVVNGIAPNSISNPDLSWERNRQLDIGLELGLFQNRVFLVADFYNKITSDLLLNVPTPSITGYTSARQNIGKVQNQGWELGLTTRNLNRELKWTTDFNISINRNKVLALGPSGEPIFGNYELSNSHITEIGKPLGNFYGYEVIGIFQTQEEIDNNPSFADSRPGHFRFRDVNGDGVLSILDRTILGNPLPNFIFGLTNTLSYKGFDLNVLIQGVQGGEIMHLGRRFYANYAGTANGLRHNAWKSPQEPGDGKTPRVNRDLSRYSSSNASANISSDHIEDGSFVRVRNISLGYNLPTGLVNKISLTNARVYLNMVNPITWTKYSGYNPEVSVAGANPLTPGVDYGGYPIARTITLGLNIGL
ncbi:TonB-dependent receptor [Rhabdobacter roseus]|uniref:TonB-linked SusC/RagA family outer membrane protein n=1 Tax=Rhabdobacter roseus TaxID=1655419 RepID=A0A840TZF1_9BACT|nr:TonB-dependent receptor [Rhabdobacter roseus]MBB5285280.1 TonB-linked SusC/RagA family outer membrane protein [Rhabdobacter roseus]